jgi:hypothetical protein
MNLIFIKYRIVSLFLFLTILFSGCTNRTCSTELIVGKYFNYFEDNSTHYIEIRKDSTYVHYYESEIGKRKVNTGRWSHSNRSNKCKVSFKKWIDFSNKSDNSNFEKSWVVELYKDELIFDYDLPKERNFKKDR